MFRYRLPFLRKQAACLTWTSPPNEVAYEEDEREAQRLSGGQPRGADFTTLFGDGKVRAYYNAPRPLDYFYDMETGVGLPINDLECCSSIHVARRMGQFGWSMST